MQTHLQTPCLHIPLPRLQHHLQNAYIPCFPDNKTYPQNKPSVIFEDDFNVSPTLRISPSCERQKDKRVKHSFFVFIQTALMRCMPSFSKSLFLASKNNDDTKTILACSFVTHLHS